MIYCGIVILFGLCVLGFICGLSLFVDLWVRFLSRVNRRKLSRHCWANRKQWMERVTEASSRMVKSRPTLRIYDKNWGILYAKICGFYTNRVSSSWHYAPLIASVKGEGDETDVLSGIKVEELDDGFGLYLLWRLKDFSFQMMKVHVDKFVALLKLRENSEGLICYRNWVGMKDMFFVDSIPFMCPGLIRYGVQSNQANIVDLAIRQIKFYYDVGYYSVAGLYATGCSMSKRMSNGLFGWGRGTGWWCLGILFSYLECPEGEYKAWLKTLLEETAANIVKWQCKDGGWCTYLVLQYPYDSTATAIFVYFLMQVDKINQTKRYADVIQCGIEKLMSATRSDGRIDLCEGDCHGFGKYSQLYTISPFGQGIVQMIVNELCGVE